MTTIFKNVVYPELLSTDPITVDALPPKQEPVMPALPTDTAAAAAVMHWMYGDAVSAVLPRGRVTAGRRDADPMEAVEGANDAHDCPLDPM